VTWVPGDNANDPGTLLWTMDSSGASFLQRTSLSGSANGSVTLIDMPLNLNRPPMVGDLSYDPFRKENWAVDRRNMLVYSFNALGDLTGSSTTQQIPVPRAPNGSFQGGVSVVESDASKLVLDHIVEKVLSAPAERLRVQNELVRMSYNRSGNGVVVPGTEQLALDLRTILQATEIGGVTLAKEGEDSFAYVVGIDTQTIYKLRMDSGLRGKDFKRGEVTGDGGPPNISDPIAILLFLFKSGPQLPCEDAADINDDEKIDLSDAVALFTYLFRNGAAPPEPFAACGKDFDPPLICVSATCS